MDKHEPLYKYPLSYAVSWGEKDKWRKSYRENIVCANDIEKVIAENYDGERLNTGCVKALIDKHGFSRLNWVLGATVLEHICDGRISEENKQWARKIGAVAENLRIDFCVNSHPGLVNLLVDSARKQWQMSVQGFIEVTYPFDDGTVFISNETSKLDVLEGNRRINGDIYCGNIIIAAEKGDDFGDLTDEQAAKGQIKQVVNNVVFPVIDVVLAVLFFAKVATAYMDYRKHGQFEFTAPAILFACLVFSMTAPLYIWSIVGI